MLVVSTGAVAAIKSRSPVAINALFTVVTYHRTIGHFN